MGTLAIQRLQELELLKSFTQRGLVQELDNEHGTDPGQGDQEGTHLSNRCLGSLNTFTLKSWRLVPPRASIKSDDEAVLALIGCIRYPGDDGPRVSSISAP